VPFGVGLSQNAYARTRHTALQTPGVAAYTQNKWKRGTPAVLHEFAVYLPCDKSVAAVCQSLSAAGLRVEQSFNLHAALALFPNCTCPHHGTAMCDCQYTVLLVYGQALSAPVTVVVHGHDNRSWITVSDPPNGWAPEGLSLGIVQTLAAAHLIELNDDSDMLPGDKTI
jgi:hypothetical protein